MVPSSHSSVFGSSCASVVIGAVDSDFFNFPPMRKPFPLGFSSGGDSAGASEVAISEGSLNSGGGAASGVHDLARDGALGCV